MNATIKAEEKNGNASVGTGPSSQFGIAGRRGIDAAAPAGVADPRKEPMTIGFTRIAAREAVEGMKKGTMNAEAFRKTVKEITTMASESPKFKEDIIGVMVDEMRRPIARMANGSKDAGEFYSIVNKAICDLKGFNPDAEYMRA